MHDTTHKHMAQHTMMWYMLYYTLLHLTHLKTCQSDHKQRNSTPESDRMTLLPSCSLLMSYSDELF